MPYQFSRHSSSQVPVSSPLRSVAIAVLLLMGLGLQGEAHALALGRLSIQSGLGESLRAEIDILKITDDEAASLRIGVAPQELFRAAGMEFSAVLSETQVSLQRRPDGSSFLSVSSPRAVNEPFVDLILEASWSSGRLVRDYTLLFDPPSLKQTSPIQTDSKSTSNLPIANASAPVASNRSVPGSVPPITGTGGSGVTPPEKPASPRAATQQVQAGDTAGRIALLHLPSNISLEQMLVAMLKANPEAFVNGNVNRLKAGVVLDLPDSSAAQAVDGLQAKQMIATQSRDFNEFRRRLAGQAPATAVASASRQASGQIQADVADQKQVVTPQDKLTLSKATVAVPQKTVPEDKVVQALKSQSEATRASELARNIKDLDQLGASITATDKAADGTANNRVADANSPSGEGISVTPGASVPANTVASSDGSTPPSNLDLEADAARSGAGTPAASEEPNFIDQLMGNPLLLPAAGALLALLGVLGIYRWRQRQKLSAADSSSFLESRFKPDSFFGSSGGKRIDTSEVGAVGSSVAGALSQLDAAGDVDPVAEADVYLAYGRDLQAEEILKEALRNTPTRIAVHNKLLEIYAKQKDAKSFEVIATQIYQLTQGQGPDWEHACSLGKLLDVANPLYQPGGNPTPKGGLTTNQGDALNFSSSTQTQTFGASPHTVPGIQPDGRLNLDLDLNLDQPSGQSGPTFTTTRPLVTKSGGGMTHKAVPFVPDDKAGPASLPMDFDLDFPSSPAVLSSNTKLAGLAVVAANAAEDTKGVQRQAHPESVSDAIAFQSGAATAASSGEILAFDLSDINLDLQSKTVATSSIAESSQPVNGLSEENPLETKLALAEELLAMGNVNGARSIAEEVALTASGALKSKAAAFVNNLP